MQVVRRPGITVGKLSGRGHGGIGFSGDLNRLSRLRLRFGRRCVGWFWYGGFGRIGGIDELDHYSGKWDPPGSFEAFEGFQAVVV